MKYKSAITVSIIFALAAFAIPGFASIDSTQEQSTPPARLEVLSAEALNNLVAPIALYPDPLLSQILVASTYPLEVVEANQWLQRNNKLKGEALIDAARQQPWDPSVQALVAVPDALSKLNEDIQWTTDLGNAFLAQQADVMSAVQRMRVQAQSNGRLASTPQQSVTTETQGKSQVVTIVPADPQVIYVPVYDPLYVWGPPVYGYYPPLYYPYYGFGFGTGCNLGFYFSDWGGWRGWGWRPNWLGSVIVLNDPFFRHHGFRDRPGFQSGGRTVWVHNPNHRLNVPYRNAQVATRFGGRVSVPSASRSSERVVGQSVRSISPQGLSSQNPVRRQYQASPQQYRTAPQVQRLQRQIQPRYQSPQYRPAPRVYAAPRVQQFQNRVQPRYQASPQFRSAPQGGSRFGAGGSSRGGAGGARRR